MKTKSVVSIFSLVAAAFFGSPPSVVAQFTNSFGGYDTAPGVQNIFILPSNYLSLETLVAAQLPRASLMESCSGTFYSLANRQGDQIQVTPGRSQMPQPITNAIGYWDSPIMNFLGRQKMRAATEHDAVAAVQLYLSLWGGIDYMQEKLCHARRFGDRWVVTVDHDFKNHPGNILAVMPFELQVDSNSSIVQFRERCYDYPGSAKVYTNVLSSSSTWKANQKIDDSGHFADVINAKLEKAWKKEQGK